MGSQVQNTKISSQGSAEFRILTGLETMAEKRKRVYGDAQPGFDGKSWEGWENKFSRQIFLCVHFSLKQRHLQGRKKKKIEILNVYFYFIITFPQCWRNFGNSSTQWTLKLIEEL